MAEYNDNDFVCLNPEMYDLMDNLKLRNKTLPPERQLPDVLFLALTWAIYEWRQMMAEDIREDREEELTALEWWREKSGYNDLHFIQDRFGAALTAEERRVIAAFTAWGGESHFFDYLAEVRRERAKKARQEQEEKK